MPPLFLKEMFRYTDWARNKAFALVVDLPDISLDRSFEMGLGSIRNTLHHIWAAERVWLDRWTLEVQPTFIQPEAGLPIAALRDRYASTAAERDAHLAALSEADLANRLTFCNSRGETYSLPLGGQMLHVCNHGIHHRAQLVNMLRHVGGAVPQRGLDYIFYRLERIDDPAPALSVEPIRTYQASSDWATRKLLAIAAGLAESQLDRTFEMGMGTLRKTLCHLLASETWWYANWTSGPAGAFPPADAPVSAVELSRRFEDAFVARDRFMNGLMDDDLSRPIEVRPRPDLTLHFPLGTSLVQLCGHATHHRAQVLNMLRHVGVAPPGLDLITWLREQHGYPK